MRSPLFYPLNRGMDAEAGGAAELQTDVMRFMAIISMCLVAIFAIVQSIPLAPVIEQRPPEPITETLVIEEPVIPEPVHDPVLTRPIPTKIEVVQETVTLQRPVLRLVERASTVNTMQEPDPVPATKSATPAQGIPDKPQAGFTLRFESDQALTRLVARDVVGLYAITADKTQRMSIDSGTLSFWSASAPAQFHEMDVATVPETVLSAFRRNNAAAPSATKWGVSIPAAMSRQLNQYLAEQTGGSLIISLDGALRLEQ